MMYRTKYVMLVLLCSTIIPMHGNDAKSPIVNSEQKDTSSLESVSDDTHTKNIVLDTPHQDAITDALEDLQATNRDRTIGLSLFGSSIFIMPLVIEFGKKLCKKVD